MKCIVCEHTGPFKEIAAICTIPESCKGERLIRHICPSCDAIFGTQEVLNMGPAEAAKFNFSKYTAKDIAVREKNNLRHLERIGGLVKPGQKVLNWGSGPAAMLGRRAEEKFGIRFDNFDLYVPPNIGVFTKYEQLGSYDLIFSTDVLEHLLKPVEEMKRMKEYLNKGGRIVHHTPCYRYCYAYTKLHVCFFVGRSVNVLAKRTGTKAKFLNRETVEFLPV